MLDPTLLFPKEKWLLISSAPDIDIPSDYIVTYFLGSTTEAQKKYINEYAKKNNLSVIDIEDNYYDKVGPTEFIYLISNSSFVFTDSFHGTAFSLIFNKDFLVFQRNKIYDMSSRITTILKKFKLENRFLKIDNNCVDDTFFSVVDEIKNQDTSHLGEIIKSEQNKANDFLKKVFMQEE